MKKSVLGWRLATVSAVAALSLTLAACGEQPNAKAEKSAKPNHDKPAKEVKAAQHEKHEKYASAPLDISEAVAKRVKLQPGGLYELVYNAANNHLYVASFGKRHVDDSSIIELDADSLETVEKIELKQGVFGLALNDATQTLYGTATIDGVVKAIDAETGKVLATIGTGKKAHLRTVLVDEGDNRIYAAAMGHKDSPNVIWVIDGETNKLVEQIEVDIAGMAGIGLDAKHDRVFALSRKDNNIVVIDLASQQPLATWEAGGEAPMSAVYDAANNRLFVANFKSGTLTVLNAQTGELLASVKTGAGALDMAYDADSGLVYVTNRDAHTVSVVDADSYKVVKQITTGTYPQTAVIDEAGSRVYVSNKALSLPYKAPKDAVPPKDPNGDTVVLIEQS